MDIVILSAIHCVPCEQLKSLLTAHDINFTVVNFRSDEGKRLRTKFDFRYAPQLLVDGKFITIRGDSPDVIIEKLKKLEVNEATK